MKCNCGKAILLDAEDEQQFLNKSFTCLGKKRVTESCRPQRAITHLLIKIPVGFEVDHVNHDQHDNRRVNLRLVTHQQNLFNRRSFKQSSSRFKGVCFNKAKGKWQAAIKFNNESIYLGLFLTEVEAAKAYNAKAEQIQKQFAVLNNVT